MNKIVVTTGTGKYSLYRNDKGAIDVYSGDRKTPSPIGNFVGVVDDLRMFQLRSDNECFIVEKAGEKAVIADATRRAEVDAYSHIVIRDDFGNLKVLPIATRVQGSLDELANAASRNVKPAD